jgi:outer membrane protein OmpA-like peptidoglycan-associated protein
MMSFNPIESVKAVFSGEMMNKMAGILGESTTNVQQAMQGIIPSVMTGIVLKTEFGDPYDTFNLSKEAAKIEIPFNQTSLAWWWNTNYKGIDYLKSLFGDKTADLTEAIASYSGVSKKSASSLLNVAAPAAYSVFGKYALETNMNVSGWRNFLDGEKKKILNHLPAGIFMEGIMGFENMAGLSEKFASIENPMNRRKSGIKWVLPTLIIVLSAVAVWYFLIKQAPAETALYSVVHRSIPTKDTFAKIPVSGNKYSVRLPAGKLLFVKKGGIEDQLIKFFNDPKSRPSRRFPFNFDQLNFDEGSAVITTESMTQIQNIALILKAYPKAKIKIGAFNEKGGDSTLNSTISGNRAAAVSKALKAAGTNPNQIAGAEGFGSDFAKYAAEAADSLKEKDERISISIRAK